MYGRRTLAVGLLLGILVLPACSGNRRYEGPRPRGDRGDWIGTRGDVWGAGEVRGAKGKKDKKPKKAKKNNGKGKGQSRGNGRNG